MPDRLSSEAFDPLQEYAGLATVPAALTWSRLRTFLAVVDFGGVAAAADLLRVTAPAVSAAVSVLESELGTKLFAKSGRGVVPTEAGLVFAEHCRTLLGLVQTAREATRDAETARLRLGVVETAAETLLPGLLATFSTRHPGVELAIVVEPRDELFARLGHHELDLVLAGRPPRGSGFISRATRENSLIVVGAPGTGGNSTSGQRRDEVWLLRGHGSGTRETALGLLARMEPRPGVLTLGTQGACLAAARAGLGVTLVHLDAAKRDLELGALKEVRQRGTPLRRPWHLCTGPRPTRVAELFLAHVTDVGAAGEHPFRAVG
ncbi:MAG: LysR family transcriptional regulator [Propionibacteriaceae bacterium]|nr:LysR family transcriptional regulator [Propionibacteriaceae bacterium]